jgi:DNA repair protein RadD
MNGSIIIRDYQEIALQALFNFLMTSTGDPIIAMPTGTGKAVVIAEACRRIMNWWPDRRIMNLTHVKELVEQNARRMLEIWPHAPVGVYSASLKSRQSYMPITFGGVKSVFNAREEFPVPDMIKIDECHLVSPNDDTMYRELINFWREKNPRLVVVGYTATWWRLGQGSLTEGNGLFTDKAIDMTDMLSFNWFIEQGYLTPLKPRPTNTLVDVSGVGISSTGDYNKGELEDATERVTYGALREACEMGWDRRKWLVFAAGNKNAEHASEILNSLGISSTFVHSGLNTKERDARIEAFKAGSFRAIVNNNILTTGFDDAAIDYIVMLRKTMSPGLWVQMLGRGTRPLYHPGYTREQLNTDQQARLAAIYYGGKHDCLVADFARNTRDLGPINDPRIPGKPGSRDGDAPVKICDQCGCYCHTSVRVCPHCGYEFPFRPSFQITAGNEELIRSDAPQFDYFDVTNILYSSHRAKESGKTLLKVTYACRDPSNGLTRFFDEYIGLEHTGFMLHKAHNWWKARHWSPPPDTDQEGSAVQKALSLQAELRRPIKVRVWTNKKYPEIVNYEYE